MPEIIRLLTPVQQPALSGKVLGGPMEVLSTSVSARKPASRAAVARLSLSACRLRSSLAPSMSLSSAGAASTTATAS
eukprot:5693733-Alexandrium_andersonii.AAC.2